MTAGAVARVVVEDLARDPDETGGWRVDIHDYECAGLYDTRGQRFVLEYDARQFAANLGALLMLPVEDDPSGGH